MENAQSLIYIYIYGCESKCKVWIMLRAHMCSRPTIQTSDPDPFRGNDPDVMIQTEMMNNSIDVRTPCGIVQKAISHVECHTFLYVGVSSADLKINYKAALHGSRWAFQGECLHWWCVQTSLRAELLVLQQGRRVQHCSNFWTDYPHSGPHSVPDPVPDRSRPDPEQN